MWSFASCVFIPFAYTLYPIHIVRNKRQLVGRSRKQLLIHPLCRDWVVEWVRDDLSLGEKWWATAAHSKQPMSTTIRQSNWHSQVDSSTTPINDVGKIDSNRYGGAMISLNSKVHDVKNSVEKIVSMIDKWLWGRPTVYSAPLFESGPFNLPFAGLGWVASIRAYGWGCVWIRSVMIGTDLRTRKIKVYHVKRFYSPTSKARGDDTVMKYLPWPRLVRTSVLVDLLVDRHCCPSSLNWIR